jgi:exodeoxyribonuclease VII large subunit
MLPASHNQPEYSVSELSGAVKRVMEDNFGHVRLRGEISGYKGPASSGHCYFCLKDEKTKIDAIVWRGSFSKLGFKPEEGMEVVAIGRVTTYPGRSSYQIIIEALEPAGAGALMALLEKRKQALAKEGLFDPARKKPLPFMPQVIGVVTSPTGAVIRDILHRISDRFPCHVLVWPVRVQGEGAAEEIAAAIRDFNQLPTHIAKPDVLIVARGGGSLEDLWCFNEEIVVRAAAASIIPLISAVGHETDTTLIDFASDRRAPTPTAAAEMAVPVREEWLLSVSERGQQLQQCMLRGLTRRQERVEGMARGIPKPQRLLEFATQRLDDMIERLTRSLPTFIERKQQRLQLAATRHQPQPLLQHIAREQRGVEQCASRLQPLILRQLADRDKALQSETKLFDSLNYRNVLKRGFAIVRSKDGAILSSRQAVADAGSFQIMLQDGEITAQTDASKSAKTMQQELF